MGNGKGAFAKRGRLRLGDAATAEFAVQRECRPHGREILPNPLDFARALRSQARAPGGEGEPRTGAGGRLALEQGMEVPPLRQYRGSPGDGESRSGLPEVRRSRRSRVPVSWKCLAHAPRQGKERETRGRRALQP